MSIPCVTAHFLCVLSDSAGQTAFSLGALSMAAVIVAALGWSLRDRTDIDCAGYVVRVGVMGSADKPLAATIKATWAHRSGAVLNALPLPSAFLFLLLVSNYFRVKIDFPGWARCLRGVGFADLPVALRVAGDFLRGGNPTSSRPIRAVNLVNRVGCTALAVHAVIRVARGASWFLVALIPVTIAGLLMAVPFFTDETGNGLTRLLPFQTALWLNLVLFLLALAIRYRGLRAELILQAAVTRQAEQRVMEEQAPSRAKSDFLATRGHEIRTPMNGVGGFTNHA